MLELHNYLRLMAETSASDLFISSGSPVLIKNEGLINSINDQPLSADNTHELAHSLMSEHQARQFHDEMEMNFAYDLPDTGRFRINIYRQRGDVALVIRMIRHQIPGFKELNLPEVLQQLVMLRSGLVLIVGATG
eukprot:Anaeramoba_flamelloidesc40278_g1_i5.p1 GENE.c40278_g1_i5~~c40278_g1_i5.p1  ORF type:complete len:135 (-),score=6.23 c40278_g1_i5:23-427(-)